jgi:hypothetical protein
MAVMNGVIADKTLRTIKLTAGSRTLKTTVQDAEKKARANLCEVNRCTERNGWISSGLEIVITLTARMNTTASKIAVKLQKITCCAQRF